MPSGQDNQPAVTTKRWLEAFSAADLDGMRATLDPDVVAHITNAEGGVDEVRGRERPLSRIEAMDHQSASFSVELTQPPGALTLGVVPVLRVDRSELRLFSSFGHYNGV